jgi:uncharacterized protein with GYD domain
METKLIIGGFIFLIFFTLGDILIYADYKDKTIKQLKESEKIKNELKLNMEEQGKELNEQEACTYSDILIMMKLEQKFKMIKFDKSDSSNGRIFITIESNENSNNIRKDLDGIIRMKNFVSLKNISVKGGNITVNAEFKMNYK